MDKIILNDNGVIIGYQNDNSSYIQKIDNPIWVKPDTQMGPINTEYNNNIAIRRNTNVTPGLTYKKLCNRLGSCLSTFGDSDDNYPGAPLIQTSINNTNKLWAMDGENLCNQDGYCIFSINNYDGTQLLQMNKQSGDSQKWIFNGYNSNICNKGNGKCIASRDNKFVENGGIIQWSKTNENGQLFSFTN